MWRNKEPWTRGRVRGFDIIGFIEKFIRSGEAIVKVTGWEHTHKNLKSITGSLAQTITIQGYDQVVVLNRHGEVYLLNVKMIDELRM